MFTILVDYFSSYWFSGLTHVTKLFRRDDIDDADLSWTKQKKCAKICSFFDELYSKYSIERVWASRNINANPKKRGKLTEILVHNYNIEQTNFKNKTTDILSVAEDSIRYGKRF